MSRPIAFDLKQLERLADPHPLYQRMRETDPVHWSEEFQAWFATGYPEVSEALLNPHLSNARTSRIPERLKAIDPHLFKDYRRVLSKALFMTDPPRAYSLASPLSGSFHSRRRRTVAPRYPATCR